MRVKIAEVTSKLNFVCSVFEQPRRVILFHKPFHALRRRWFVTIAQLAFEPITVSLRLNCIQNSLFSLILLVDCFDTRHEISTIKRLERLKHVQEAMFNVHARTPKRTKIEAIQWFKFFLPNAPGFKDLSKVVTNIVQREKHV